MKNFHSVFFLVVMVYMVVFLVGCKNTPYMGISLLLGVYAANDTFSF